MSSSTEEIVYLEPEYLGQRLTPQKKAAALQLAAGRKPSQICERFDITPRTLRTWQRDALFLSEVSRLQKAEEEFVHQMNENLRDLCTIAAANVADVITRPIPTLEDADQDKDIRGTDVVNMAKLQTELSMKVLATQGVSPVSKQHIKADTTQMHVHTTLEQLANKFARKNAKKV